ncbi:hypothetical protein LEP1GSC172_3349 [Leptospira noguchii]|uniref:Uncharacterized protein n=1 Tax=Leptospira noguchii TaxID=28182 RepID=M6VSQ8_9LEPT|nr:hypothetical protein LEP1GSC172_3349 [Leptospira noguchii]
MQNSVAFCSSQSFQSASSLIRERNLPAPDKVGSIDRVSIRFLFNKRKK